MRNRYPKNSGAIEVTDRMAAGRIGNAREALRAAAVNRFVN
jgi:hypothetical protein